VHEDTINSSVSSMLVSYQYDPAQLGPVPVFAQRRVAHTMSRCFLFLLHCHWRWIGWRCNPTLEAAIQKGLVIIIEKKECMGTGYENPNQSY
jgi:hypothetical protein